MNVRLVQEGKVTVFLNTYAALLKLPTTRTHYYHVNLLSIAWQVITAYLLNKEENRLTTDRTTFNNVNLHHGKGRKKETRDVRRIQPHKSAITETAAQQLTFRFITP